MGAQVFVSHSSKDRKVARTICSALESRGLSCWIASRDVGPGENFMEAIVRAIRAAKISLDLSRQQMETGQANVLFLLLAQQTYLQATIAVVQARANRLADTAALFQALGGGWWNRVEPPTEKIREVGSNTAFTLIDPHVLIDPHGLY